jgi:mRNA interferase YafQ
MYVLKPTARYKKSLRHIARNPKFRIRELETVIDTLAKGKMLAPHYKDHALKGKWEGIRECHVRNDILLLYRREQDALILLLVDIGTHSSLFGI